MSYLPVWKFILERIERSEAVVLLCVLDSKGSSPGRPGFKMAVSGDDITGSIGGGIMEHKFVELAREKLRTGSGDVLIRKQFHNKSADKDQSGMICSGEQTLALFTLTAQQASVVRHIADSIESLRPGVLRLTPREINFSSSPGSLAGSEFSMQSATDWIYRENTGRQNRLYIIGGGHCALALSALMHPMDFYITLLDDRAGLNTFVANTRVHEKQLVADYSRLGDFVQAGECVYVVVMTFGYRTDDIALRALIGRKFRYLGVLGSRAKIEKLMTGWKQDGLPEAALKKLYAPVGLPINSHTPEEIAVSIAAEIIAVKNTQSNA
jgi:xanthine dehydrogenase accessory factor